MTINQTPALSKLRCPHDFSYHDDFRDNLSTLLNGTDVINVPEKENPLRLSVFDGIANASVVEVHSFLSTSKWNFFYLVILVNE